MEKILQINTVAKYSSTGRIVDGIGNLILKEGWKSHVAYGRKKMASDSELYQIGSKWSIYTHVALTRLFDKHGYGSKGATTRMIAWAKKIRPTLIHLHNLHGYYLNLPLLFEYLSNLSIPIVISFHDSWNLTGHCTQFDNIGCEKWKTVCHDCPLRTEYPKSILIDRSRENHLFKKKGFMSLKNTCLVTSSQWSKELIEKSFFKGSTIRIIPNGVDTSVFSPKEKGDLRKKHNLGSKNIILGVASVWTVNKGYLDFMKLAEQISDEDILVLIGLSEKQLKQIPNNILGIQRTENIEQLAEWYSEAKVFVNLTYADTFPTTNLEALACGTPVITYKTGGSSESVDERTGFVVSQGNLKGVVSKINLIKEKTSDFYEKNCRSKAIKEYEKNQQFYEYIKIYKELFQLKNPKESKARI